MTPQIPKPPLTREQVRKVDRLAIEELGIPGVVLMENAGRNATDLIQKDMQQRGAKLDSALILCGGGNNGGDGYVIARHLHNQGVQVQIFTTKPIDQLTGDAAINARICKNMNLSIQPASLDLPASDLIIDTLLGTGFAGDLRPDMLQLIQAINATRDLRKPDPDASPSPVVAAIDIPSGLHCDTGQPAQAAVHADLTVTFVAPKLGFSQPAAEPYLGRVEVVDIGVPPNLIEKACL